MGLTAQGVEGMTGVRRVPVDLQKIRVVLARHWRRLNAIGGRQS
jgi:hypothetical protein